MPYTIFDQGSPQPYRLAVYLVDDSVTDRELAVEAFEDGAGRVEVTPFPDGPSVLGALRTPGVTLPDVILLDLNMPTMTGFQVLAALKDDPTLSVIPVVMLTSSADEGDVRRAYSLHANSYIIKAVDFTQFVQQLDTFVTYWQSVRRPRFTR